jgi:hypothetical protein
MADLVSEPLTPRPGAFDAAAMARGEPGMPPAFTWRGTEYEVIERLESWKASGPATGGGTYLRRHYHKLRMSDGNVWTVYFVRQTPRSGSPKARWFLYTIDRIRNAECGTRNGQPDT